MDDENTGLAQSVELPVADPVAAAVQAAAEAIQAETNRDLPTFADVQAMIAAAMAAQKG